MKGGILMAKDVTKTPRTSFVLDPKVQSDATALAQLQGKSLNGLVSEMLKNYVDMNQEVIEEFKKLSKQVKPIQSVLPVIENQ